MPIADASPGFFDADPIDDMLTLQPWTLGRVQNILERKGDIHSNGDGVKALTSASGHGDIKLMKFLISHKIDVNSKDNLGNTPLYAASMNGEMAPVAYLLEQKADVNAKSRRGRTALMPAVVKRKLDLAKLLLQKNADVNAKSKSGWTCLHMASDKGSTAMAKFLIENKADVRQATEEGHTSLMAASENDSAHVVKLLIERTAELESRNSDGKTALDLAVTGMFKVDTVTMLLRGGADYTANHADNKKLRDICRHLHLTTSQSVFAAGVLLKDLCDIVSDYLFHCKG